MGYRTRMYRFTPVCFCRVEFRFYIALNPRQGDNFMKYKIKQITKMDILYSQYSRKKKKQENNGVGDISSLFQKHARSLVI